MGNKADINVDFNSMSASLADDSNNWRLSRGLTEDVDSDIVASQFIQRGFSWEERLIKQLRDAGHNVILGAQSDNTRQTDVKIAVQEFLRELSQLQNTTDKSRRVFFYQPTLVALPSVYADLEIDNALMELGTCYPDLIEVEFKEPNTRELVIIDAKATTELKISHKIQIGLYYLLLSAMINSENKKPGSLFTYIVSVKPGVWLTFVLRECTNKAINQPDMKLSDQKNYSTFNLQPILTHLRAQFSPSGTVACIIKAPIGETSWHLQKKCTRCTFRDFCTSEATQPGVTDLSLVRNVALHEKSGILDFLKFTGEGNCDIESALPKLNKRDKSIDVVVSIEEIVDPELKVQENELRSLEEAMLQLAVNESTLMSQDPSLGGSQSSSTTLSPPTSPRNPLNVTPSIVSDPPLSPFVSIGARDTPEASPMFRKSKLSKKPKKSPSLLQRDLWFAKRKIESFSTKTTMPLYRASRDIPISEDLAVILSVYTDMPSSCLHAFSIGLFSSKGELVTKLRDSAERLGMSGAVSVVALDQGVALYRFLPVSNVEDAHSLTAYLVQTLYNVMQYCSELYSTKETVSFYIWSESEAKELQRTLSDVADSTHDSKWLASTILGVLFDTAELAARLRHPNLEKGCPHRLVVVKKAIDRTLALPLRFDAEINEFLAVFNDRVANECDTSSESAMNILYSGLSVEKMPVLLVWRLKQIVLIIEGARSALRSFSDLALVRKPAPFVFRQYLKVYHSTLSKLGFMIQYETYIACRKKTDDRTSILSALHGKPQLMEDRCAMLRYSGTHNTFTLVKKLPKTLHIFKYESLSDTIRADVELRFARGSTSKDWLICSLEHDSLWAALELNDYITRCRPKNRFSWITPNNLAYARIVSINERKKEMLVEASLGKVFRGFQPGCHYVLSPIEVDLTSDDALEGIKTIDRVSQCRAALRLQSQGFVEWVKDIALQQVATGAPEAECERKENSAALLSLSELLGIRAVEPEPAKKSRTSKQATTESPQSQIELSNTATEPRLKLTTVDGDMLGWQCIAIAAQELLGEYDESNVPMNILDDAEQWGVQAPSESPESTTRARELGKQARDNNILTQKQLSILNTAINQRLLCVHGPPGTGKSHFLATAAVVLAKAHRSKLVDQAATNTGATFRILLTAFTHASIDNLIDKVLGLDSNLIAKSTETQAPLPIARLINEGAANTTKFGRATEPELDSKKRRQRPVFPDINPQIVYTTAPKEVNTFLVANPQCVIAGTIWAIKKFFSKNRSHSFNLLIVDEASQMLLSHALLPLQFLHPTNSRIIFAGDHHQLPPIQSGEYPPDSKSSKNVFGSVFDFLQSWEGCHRYTRMLSENWRMCDVLSELPSKYIYNREGEPTLAPGSIEISVRRFDVTGLDSLHLKYQSIPDAVPISVASPILRTVLDGDLPFVMILIKQSMGYSVNPFPQAPLIACFASAIRRILQYSRPSESDLLFWRERLLVIAPHHIQRQQIRTQLLNKTYTWSVPWDTDERAAPAIETVEKAQGREFDTIIVDYCILDPARIAKEAKFLYSRNRINVAQSRARSKCIFIVSDTLLKYSPAQLNTPGAEAATTYLNAMVQFAKTRQAYIEIEGAKLASHIVELQSEAMFM